jgi:cellulose synthase/poly-beta-1,6-N-acetylglucosamine synthase-like glycosyltransferase
MDWARAILDLLIQPLLWLSALILIFAVGQNLFYLYQTIMAWLEFRRNHEAERLLGTHRIMTARTTPGISIIAPAYNEEANIVESVRSLLSLHYPAMEVIVVNDGSKDQTASRMIEAFDLQPVHRAYAMLTAHKPIRGIYRSARFKNLLFIDKENGGKSDALNAGINLARHPLFCSIDADSILDADALLRAARPFVDSPNRVIAAGGTIRVANGCRVYKGTILEEHVSRKALPLFQTLEYFRAFLIARLAFSRMKSVTIISGAFGLFSRKAVLQIGGYSHGTVGEDMELVVRLNRFFCERRTAYAVRYIPDPVCWTEVPETLKVLRRQRTRWQRGLCETLARHRVMVGRPRYGRTGTIAMPLFVIFDVVGPILDLIGLVLIPILAAAGVLSLTFFLAYFSVVCLFGIFLSILALILAEKSRFRSNRLRDMVYLLLGAIIENFGYRQLNNLWRIEGLFQFLQKKQGWGEMTRTGFKATTQAPGCD